MYLSFFGLREEPFQITSNPRFLYLAEPHRNALIAVLGGVVYRRGFILATGPIGTGKTTLLHTALDILSRKFGNTLVSAFLVNPTLTRDEFLETLLDEFEIACPASTKPRRVLALRQLFLDTQRNGGTSVLILDEAHLLSSEVLEEIRLLSNADTYQEKPLQIVLSGQPELVSMLDTPALAALRQRIAVRATLRTLTAQETTHYVGERLRVSGLRGNLPFSMLSLESIHYYAGGVPRLINLLCDRCLSLAYEQQHREVDGEMVTHAARSLALIDGSADDSARATAVLLPPKAMQAHGDKPLATFGN